MAALIYKKIDFLFKYLVTNLIGLHYFMFFFIILVVIAYFFIPHYFFIIIIIKTKIYVTPHNLVLCTFQIIRLQSIIQSKSSIYIEQNLHPYPRPLLPLNPSLPYNVQQMFFFMYIIYFIIYCIFFKLIYLNLCKSLFIMSIFNSLSLIYF